MALHTKYRPTLFKHVIGQDHTLKSLQQTLKNDSCHTFIFTGPSGVGKTTLARIIARKLKIADNNLMEVDAATHTGVDAMRAIADMSRYSGLGDSKRLLIIDEAHMLSKAAWNSLLKIIEEPPLHCWWCFCTTEPEKIPATIQTRCLVYQLDVVDADDIEERLKEIAKKEDFSVSDEVLALVATRCEGSPRRALTMLEQVSNIKALDEASKILNVIQEGDDNVIQLCRKLASGKLDWTEATALLKDCKNVKAESLRIVVFNYFTAVAMSQKTNSKRLPYYLGILDAFAEPYPSHASGLGNVLISLGEVLVD